MELKNAGYLFLWLHRSQLPSGGTLQANYLRTWPDSSNEASLLCSSLPGMWEGAHCTEPTPVACTRVARTALLPKWCGQHLPPPLAGGWSRGPLGPKNSKQSSTSSTAPLGRNGRRKQGVELSYVTRFLRVRGPGVSQPSPLGRGWGRGRRLFPLPLLPLFQTWAGLQEALLSKRPSSKDALP